MTHDDDLPPTLHGDGHSAPPPGGTPTSGGQRAGVPGDGVPPDRGPYQEPTAPGGDAPMAPAADPPEPVYTAVEDWVGEYFLPMFRRTLGGEFRWCAQWWQHGEAISRLTSLWHAWESLRLQPGTGIATWYRDHLDHQLPILMGARGPFYQCSETAHREPHEAAAVTAPGGWWELADDMLPSVDVSEPGVAAGEPGGDVLPSLGVVEPGAGAGELGGDVSEPGVAAGELGGDVLPSLGVVQPGAGAREPSGDEVLGARAEDRGRDPFLSTGTDAEQQADEEGAGDDGK
jgi:hypothetical protein